MKWYKGDDAVDWKIAFIMVVGFFVVGFVVGRALFVGQDVEAPAGPYDSFGVYRCTVDRDHDGQPEGGTYWQVIPGGRDHVFAGGFVTPDAVCVLEQVVTVLV